MWKVAVVAEIFAGALSAALTHLRGKDNLTVGATIVGSAIGALLALKCSEHVR